MNKKQQKTAMIEAPPVATYRLTTVMGNTFEITSTGPEDLTSQCVGLLYEVGLSYPVGIAELLEVSKNER